MRFGNFKPIQITEAGDEIDVKPRFDLLALDVSRFNWPIATNFHVGCGGDIAFRHTSSTSRMIVCKKCHLLEVEIPIEVSEGTLSDLRKYFVEFNPKE